MKKVFLLSLVIGSIASLQAQNRFEQSQASTLFKEETPLQVVISMDIEEVTKDIDERESHAGTFTLIEGGESTELSVKFKVRGNNRANPSVCPFPPLELNFKKKEVTGSLLAGQDKMKLVTHCNNRSTSRKNAIQEYLVYKQYNLLTDYSFKVRWLDIVYIDTQSGDSLSKFGFLIEAEDILTERMQMTKHKRKIYHQDQCREEAIDLFTVFQYFIGNTDWSVSEKHNVKLISNAEDQVPIPIPYDFDNSGLVNAFYARPAPSLGIPDVRTRLFRGFCREPGTYEKTFALFNEKKEELIGLYDNVPDLNERELKSARGYMEKFFDTINHPKKSQNSFTKACRLNHAHKY